MDIHIGMTVFYRPTANRYRGRNFCFWLCMWVCVVHVCVRVVMGVCVCISQVRVPLQANKRVNHAYTSCIKRTKQLLKTTLMSLAQLVKIQNF